MTGQRAPSRLFNSRMASIGTRTAGPDRPLQDAGPMLVASESSWACAALWGSEAPSVGVGENKQRAAAKGH